MDKYWASRAGEEFGQALADKLEDADPLKNLSGGRAAQIRRCYSFYYGVDEESGAHGTSQVLRGGEQGELAKVKINHSRALVNTLQNLITASKLVWSPKCVNIDADSIKQVRLAQQLLEYYFKEIGFLNKSNRCLEQALGPGAGEAFVLLDWDEAGGDDVLPDPDAGEQMAKTGDAVLHIVPTWDVFRDDYKHSWDDLDWVIVRRYLNKWDVAAQFSPEIPAFEGMPGYESEENRDLRERILAQPTLSPTGSSTFPATEDSDEIQVFYFFHKRTPAVPEGRDAIFLADGTLISDSPAKLDKWPLKRLAVAELFNTPYPYTPFLEILGIQEIMDSLESSISTNQTAFGTQYITAEKDSDISPEDLTSGLRMIYRNPGSPPPAALQLTQTPPEIFSHLEMLKKYQELIFGLNSVVRGEPQSGEQSGSALALLQSQALQQASTIQTNYLRFVEEIGDCLFEMLRKWLSGPKKLAIVGKGNAFLVNETEVSRDSFDRVKRVQVEVGNPMGQTTSGRAEIAKDLMQMGVLKSAEQYLEVLETGKLEPVTESLSNELLLIRSEGEQIRSGEMPPALILDDHMLHVREHRALLATPEARRDPKIVQACLGHIQQHEQLYFTAPPGLLIMSGQQPPPPGFGPDGRMMAPPPGAPPQGGTPPGGPPPSGASPKAPPSPAGNPDAGQAPPQGEMPEMPTNPATGQPGGGPLPVPGG